jgi:hypothetical protein
LANITEIEIHLSDTDAKKTPTDTNFLGYVSGNNNIFFCLIILRVIDSNTDELSIADSDIDASKYVCY